MVDYWLLFFTIETSMNIAVHILVDKVYQSEKKQRISPNKMNVISSEYSFNKSKILIIFLPIIFQQTWIENTIKIKAISGDMYSSADEKTPKKVYQLLLNFF